MPPISLQIYQLGCDALKKRHQQEASFIFEVTVVRETFHKPAEKIVTHNISQPGPRLSQFDTEFGEIALGLWRGL